jgi:hypothetical protein
MIGQPMSEKRADVMTMRSRMLANKFTNPTQTRTLERSVQPVMYQLPYHPQQRIDKSEYVEPLER